MRIIKLLYAIEAWATEKAMNNRQRKALRQRRAKSFLEGLHAWPLSNTLPCPTRGRYQEPSSTCSTTGSGSSVKWGALFYSLFATCAVNDINPEVWMEYVLRKINSTPESEYEKLLPIKENFPEGKIS